jgi:hypothetical protein
LSWSTVKSVIWWTAKIVKWLVWIAWKVAKAVVKLIQWLFF